jgi:hypothetical protein
VRQLDQAIVEIYGLLGRRPQSLWWSKAEILLGLAAAGMGVTMAVEGYRYAELLGPVLITLGGYLALAGHRSHLYDAMTRQTAISWRRRDDPGAS